MEPLRVIQMVKAFMQKSKLTEELSLALVNYHSTLLDSKTPLSCVLLNAGQFCTMLSSVAKVPVQGTKDCETLTDRQASMMATYNSRLLVRACGSTEGLKSGKEVFY